MAQTIFPPERPAAPPAKRLALKVDVQTYRGTLEGVPRLVQALRRHGAQATFLFTLGTEHTGARLLRMGAAARRKIGGHTLLSHYGAKTLMYGTVLPAPDIGRRCAEIMRNVRDAGFEVGIQAWDSARWREAAAASDARWTLEQMQRATDRFEEIFGTAPRVHGAAGWQMNTHAYRLTQRLGFDYCSDTRGLHPFTPVVKAELIACPQIPTTLPALDELLARDGMSPDNAAALLVKATRTLPAAAGHVYTLSAELEGMALLPLFEQIVHAWRDRGMELLSLNGYFEAARAATLPRHCVRIARLDGFAGPVALQGAEFLA
ncbi:MAG: polysaccharide deacetylase family protein [Betaproteobacteria bacterium]|nr:polysaccharide deacetylase family protein [Betaproteobacteria bacterium]